MKTFVMMTGELEYDGYYVDEPLYYPEASYALFICFVIVVPIVFMNLLVSFESVISSLPILDYYFIKFLCAALIVNRNVSK